MQQNEQFQKLVIGLRVMFLVAVGAIAGVIYILPVKRTELGAQDVFYYLLLAVSLAELAVMVFMDRQAYRAATIGEQTQFSANLPKIRSMPIILFAQALSTAFYGLVYHLVGGSRVRSLSFLIFTFIGYFIFSIATVRYSALLAKGGQSLDS